MKSIKQLLGKKENDPSKRTYAVIVKNRIDCNYNCMYCYTEDSSENNSMTLETAEIMIDKTVQYVGDKTLFFVWHGGEPLLSGLDFFYGIHDIIKKYNHLKIVNAIQTNGSFINNDFIRFCKETGFKVSTSLDGPKDMNDYTRMDKNGSGTFDRTMAFIKTMRQEGIDVSCVSVLHKKNISNIEEMYRFFKKERINFRVNPVVKAGNAVNNYNLLAISPKEYGTAMCKLFDLWFDDDDGKSLFLDPLVTIVGNILEDQVLGCNFQGRCLKSIISITPNGNIYPCGRFIGIPEFNLGNILECETLSEAFDSDIYRTLSERDADSIPGCKGCDFAAICNGGCMITAHMANSNIFDSDYYCMGRKKLFGHILKRLENENMLKSDLTKVA